jgi:NAD(P)-dependent dehydrogenase (short-subunit alcohol dehydrogenase family)
MPIETDLTDENSVKSAYETVKNVTDELYAILHFAGIYTLDSLVEIGEESFCRTFDVNVFGVYRVNKTFLPLLKSESRVLITTSELAPLEPLPFTGLYAVTKSTLDKYAYSLRMELQLLGVKVIVLRPGAVQTDMLGVSTTALDRFCENTKLYSCNAKRFKKIVESVEARNVPPEKIAKMALKIINLNRPKYVYKLNRNPLLLLLNVLPRRMQTWIIKQVLK